MITLSLNFDKATTKTNRSSHEKQVRDIIDTHLAFPGSDKLKWGVTIKDNGAASVSFTGPRDAIDEAKRLWKENVQPAANKARRAATDVKRAVTSKVKRATTNATKSARKVVKAAKVKATRSGAKAKAKAAKRTAKKRKS